MSKIRNVYVCLRGDGMNRMIDKCREIEFWMGLYGIFFGGFLLVYIYFRSKSCLFYFVRNFGYECK